MFSWFPTLWKYAKYNHLLASFPLKWSRRAICQNWEGAHLSERHGLHSIYVNSFTASVLFSMCKVFNSQWKYIGWKKLGNMLPITKEQTRYFSISNLFPIPRRNSSLWPQNLNTLKKNQYNTILLQKHMSTHSNQAHPQSYNPTRSWFVNLASNH